MMKAVLAVSDPASVEALSKALAGFEVELEFCLNLRDLRTNVQLGNASVVFCQTHLPDGGFRDLLQFAEAQESKVPVVVCSDFFDKTTYIEAMSLGAYDFIAFPYRRSEVEWIVGNALRKAASRPRGRRSEQESHREIHVHAT